MKKFLVLALVLILAVGFVGCSSQTSSGEETNKEQATEETNTQETTTEEAAAPAGDIKMGRVDYAAHGDKSFAVVVVAMQGDTIVGASIDEYQFLPKDQITAAVPNSDGAFGENYKDPNTVLGSKRTNTEYYSTHMAQEAGSTVTIDENYNAIENYVKGKTVEELETLLSENKEQGAIDAISGATLVDTPGYVKAIIEAAKSAK